MVKVCVGGSERERLPCLTVRSSTTQRCYRVWVCLLPRWRPLGTPSGPPATPPVGEFRVSSRNILGSVSLRGGCPGQVGVDERVEGASEGSPGLILLDVDQVGEPGSVGPLVEPHSGVA